MAGLTEFYCRSNETSHASQFKWLDNTFNYIYNLHSRSYTSTLPPQHPQCTRENLKYYRERTKLSRRLMIWLLSLCPPLSLPTASPLSFSVILCVARQAYWRKIEEEGRAKRRQDPNHTTAGTFVFYNLLFIYSLPYSLHLTKTVFLLAFEPCERLCRLFLQALVSCKISANISILNCSIYLRGRVYILNRQGGSN